MSRESKSQLGEEFVCKYSLQQDANKITMVANCKDCNKREEPSLNNQICLTGILNGLLEEYNVDSVILSHYMESKYTDEPIEILRMMVEIVHDMEQMGIREPYEEYFASDSNLNSSSKNQQKASCEKCELRPERIFTGLKMNFLGDISQFYDEFHSISKQVKANKKMECKNCVEATKSDLIYLFKKLENFRAYVIYKGFQIVI
ncbi:MAG: hypothetical protein JSV09_04025 [Thermoplasmata archaeon]|nr:MAG: hypothetical protein JSV09_04025 [Thermoplasmata archaeon]